MKQMEWFILFTGVSHLAVGTFVFLWRLGANGPKLGDAGRGRRLLESVWHPFVSLGSLYVCVYLGMRIGDTFLVSEETPSMGHIYLVMGCVVAGAAILFTIEKVFLPDA